jgi:hypothetical protein
VGTRKRGHTTKSGEIKMVNKYKFPLSTSPQIVLSQVIQEFTQIVTSLQNNLDHLQKDMSTEKSDIVFELEQNIILLYHLHASARKYLNEHNANLSRKNDELNIETRTFYLELLERLFFETRHSASSARGYIGLIRSNDDTNFEAEYFKGLDIALFTLENICRKVSDEAGLTKS